MGHHSISVLVIFNYYFRDIRLKSSLILNSDQESLQDTARKFTEQEIIPVAAKYDRESSFPKEIIEEASKLGLCNLTLPAENGGSELSLYDACLVIEEIAYGCAGFATSMVANDLALTPISISGSKEQKNKFIGDIVTNNQLASFCLSEPGAGSDAAGIKTTYQRKGDKFIISGNKQWITNGAYAKNFTVFATSDPNLKHKGISCFVVPADSEGITIGEHEDKLGQRCSNTTPINFDKVEVSKDYLIGEEGSGFLTAMKTLDFSRPLTAILAVGIARRAFESALEYSKERKQFSKPISNFQGIQFMLADMATNIEAARLLTFQSASLLDNGSDATLYSSMAKRFAADMGMQVTVDAVQIYGGYGYTKEYPVEKLMRDSKLMQIYEGTSQIQKIVIARELIKNG